VIEVTGRRVGDVPRTGEILEVLGAPGHVHYRVRWDDEHETLFYPAGDTRIRKAADRPLELKPATKELVELLQQSDIEFELLPHRRTQTATSEARALGVLPQETAKTVVVRADGGCIRAVVPASVRLNLEKLATFGAEPTPPDGSGLDGSYPQFELGAVPPLGAGGDRVVVDRPHQNASTSCSKPACTTRPSG
jgi:prolyl-tRNA editing enzyme YbaK/EbsC (Cys-tRNA(Pro) deacylase)